jgi:hypothetical protein
MELIPKEIEATIPDLFSTESVPHPLAVIKLFDPCSRYTFFVLEARREPDGDLRLFGFCRSPLGPDGDEFGFASLRVRIPVYSISRSGVDRSLVPGCSIGADRSEATIVFWCPPFVRVYRVVAVGPVGPVGGAREGDVQGAEGNAGRSW